MDPLKAPSTLRVRLSGFISIALCIKTGPGSALPAGLETLVDRFLYRPRLDAVTDEIDLFCRPLERLRFPGGWLVAGSEDHGIRFDQYFFPVLRNLHAFFRDLCDGGPGVQRDPFLFEPGQEERPVGGRDILR